MVSLCLNNPHSNFSLEAQLLQVLKEQIQFLEDFLKKYKNQDCIG